MTDAELLGELRRLMEVRRDVLLPMRDKSGGEEYDDAYDEWTEELVCTLAAWLEGGDAPTVPEQADIYVADYRTCVVPHLNYGGTARFCGNSSGGVAQQQGGFAVFGERSFASVSEQVDGTTLFKDESMGCMSRMRGGSVSFEDKASGGIGDYYGGVVYFGPETTGRIQCAHFEVDWADGSRIAVGKYLYESEATDAGQNPQCGQCGEEAEDIESTYCGSMCLDCRTKHAEECEVCGKDFRERGII